MKECQGEGNEGGKPKIKGERMREKMGRRSAGTNASVKENGEGKSREGKREGVGNEEWAERGYKDKREGRSEGGKKAESESLGKRR